jgi:diguanylate cyclase (GGDEF)-like protein
MPDRQTTLDEVERLLAERSGARAFSPKLNALFDAENDRRRARLLRASALRTAAIYNVFLFGDLFLTPDVLRLSVVLHLALVTPYILLVAWLLPRVKSAGRREALAATISVAMALQILTIFCTTKSPDASHYLYFVPSAVLSLISVQRLRVAYGRMSAAVVFILLLAALVYKQGIPLEITAMHSMIYVICVVVTLNSNQLVESEQRRHFLEALREKLRAAESDDDANRDPLTGLGNRRFLEKRASDLWSVGAAVDRSVAAIVFDVDHFKSFNDHYGHARGDSCLTRVAGCARAELRVETDLAFRTGGEEFLVLLPNVEIETAIGVAERIRTSIEALGIPHEGVAPGGVVTASFGVAAAQVGNCSLEALVEAADAALYAAKRSGRNRTRSQSLLQPGVAA